MFGLRGLRNAFLLVVSFFVYRLVAALLPAQILWTIQVLFEVSALAEEYKQRLLIIDFLFRVISNFAIKIILRHGNFKALSRVLADGRFFKHRPGVARALDVLLYYLLLFGVQLFKRACDTECFEIEFGYFGVR